MTKKELGEILLAADVISPSQLNEALGLQKTYGERLASVLVRKRMLTEKFAVTYLGRQLGFPGIDLSQAEIDLAMLDIVPLAVCERHSVFPVRIEDGRLQLAMADPTNRAVVEQIESRKKARVTPMVALDASIKHAIREAQQAQREGRRTIIPDVRSQVERPAQPATSATPVPTAPAPPLAAAATDAASAAEKPADGGHVAARPPDLSSAPQEPPASDAAQPAPLAVLIADLDGKERAALVSLLAEQRHRVATAASGREALTLACEQAFDLVIVEATLSGPDGMEVCRQLKQSERMRHVPVVLTVSSGLGWRFAADAKERCGAEDILERPCDGADLLRRIDLLTGRTPPGASAQVEASVRQSLKDGVVALKQQRHQDAVNALRRGLELDPFNDLLLYYLAMAYEKMDQFLPAIEHYEKAVQANPDFYDAIISLANLYQRQQFRRKALEMWELALSATREDSVRARIKEHILGLL